MRSCKHNGRNRASPSFVEEVARYGIDEHVPISNLRLFGDAGVPAVTPLRQPQGRAAVMLALIYTGQTSISSTTVSKLAEIGRPGRNRFWADRRGVAPQSQ